MMTNYNVKSLLFISSGEKVYSHCFLFQCAKYWADKGNKVLYITHQPVDNLPLSVGKPMNVQNLECFNLVRFMYLPSWKDLLKHCYSVYLQQNPVSVIIVQELENYCTVDNEEGYDQVSLICASLLHAASLCAIKNSMPAYLINSFNSDDSVIPKSISKNFFNNVWLLSVNDLESDDLEKKKLIKLTNLSPNSSKSKVRVFVFSEDNEQSFLNFEFAFEDIVNLQR